MILNDNTVLREIKLTIEECIDGLIVVCNTLNIKMENIEDAKVPSFYLLNNAGNIGMLRIYDRKDNTRTLDGSGKDQNLNVQVLNLFKEKYLPETKVSIKGPGKCATYDIKIENFDKIRKVIELKSINNRYVIEDKPSQKYIYYMVNIKDEHSGDKVVVTQYNSGVLTIQGKSWNVWDEICSVVDEKQNTPIIDLIVRYVSQVSDHATETEIAAAVEVDEAEKIANIITDSLKSRGEKLIAQRLGRVYNALYDHDKILIASSQCMLLAKVDYGDFYCYVAPVLRVIDGYLKKTIIDLGLRTETEINALDRNNTPCFNYGHVFNGVISLQPCMKAKLKNTKTSRDDKENALLQIYKLYKVTRSPLQHDGPPVVKMVPTYEDAESEIDSIIDLFKNTYEVLF